MESELPEPVDMPAPDEIPAEDVNTAAAFGAPAGRDVEERLAELEDAPQSEEGAEVGRATVFPGTGMRELREQNPDKSLDQIVAEREAGATQTEAWPPAGNSS